MKFMIALAIATVSTSAFARGYIDYPRVGGIEINQLCDAGSTFKTIQPRNVCTKTEVKQNAVAELYTGNDVVCTAHEKLIVEVSKSITKTVCLDQARASANSVGDMPNYPVQGSTACEHNSIQTQFLSNTFRVSKMEDRGELGYVEVGQVSFVIPACQ